MAVSLHPTFHLGLPARFVCEIKRFGGKSLSAQKIGISVLFPGLFEVFDRRRVLVDCVLTAFIIRIPLTTGPQPTIDKAKVKTTNM